MITSHGGRQVSADYATSESERRVAVRPPQYVPNASSEIVAIRAVWREFAQCEALGLPARLCGPMRGKREYAVTRASQRTSQKESDCMNSTTNPPDPFPGHDGGQWAPVASEVVTSWPQGHFAENLAVDPTGSVYVSLHSHNRIDRFDPKTGRVEAVAPLAPPAEGVAIDGPR